MDKISVLLLMALPLSIANRFLADTFTASAYQCQTSCIEAGKVFCPQADRSAGYCCSSSSSCPSTGDFCTDATSLYWMQLWVCPFDKGLCGSDQLLPAPSSGSLSTMRRYKNQFGARGICSYLLRFPSESQKGDQLVFLVDEFIETRAYLMVGTQYEQSMRENKVVQGKFYTVDFPNHAFIVYESEGNNAEFQFSYYFQKGGISSSTQWITVNKNLYYFNSTRNGTYNGGGDGSSSSSSSTGIQPEIKTEDAMSSIVIIVIACGVGVIVILAIIMIVCICWKLKQKKMQVKSLIKEKKNSVHQPVQMIWRADNDYSGNEDMLQEQFQDFLIRKFGTTDVTEQMYYQSRQQPPQNQEDSNQLLPQEGASHNLQLPSERLDDYSHKRILDGRDTAAPHQRLRLHQEEEQVTGKVKGWVRLGSAQNKVKPEPTDFSENKGVKLPPIKMRDYKGEEVFEVIQD